MDKVISFYTRVFVIAAIILSPFIYFLIKLRGKKKDGVLIIPQFKRIGDIVCSTPVFKAIKEKYLNSRITVIVSGMAADILKNNPRIDEVIIIEDYQHRFPALVLKIIKGNFRWGISLSGTSLSSTIFFLGLIPNRMKIVRPNRPLVEIASDWMCNFKEEYNKPSYLLLFYLKMLKHLDIESEDCRKEVFTSAVVEAKVKEFLAISKVTEEDKLVGLSLTAGNKVKEWGDDKFESLVREILKKHDVRVVLIGSSYEKDRVKDFISRFEDKNQFIDASGISLEELSSLMKRFSVFISVDTGPVHIAHALDVPLIDILGPVNDIELTPRDGKIKIIKPDPEIPPTIFAFQEPGPVELTKKALENISISRVAGVFEELF